MRRGLAGLVLGAVLAFSGCAHKAEVKPDEKMAAAVEVEPNEGVDYRWDGYTIRQERLSQGPESGVVYKFKRRYGKDFVEDKCAAMYRTKQGRIILEDNDCDGSVEWIKDSTGLCYVGNCPEERFRNANKIFNYFEKELDVKKTHVHWEKIHLWLDEMLW